MKTTRTYGRFLAGFALALFCFVFWGGKAQAAVSAYSNIQGESFDEDSSKGVSTSWENDPNIVALGWTDSGDYACYPNISFGQGASKIKLRYSKKILANVSIQVILDDVNTGKVLTTVTLGDKTGSEWTDYKTMETTISQKVYGVHKVYLKFSSLETKEQLCHIDWFTFEKDANYADNPALLPPAGLTITDDNGVIYKVLDDRKSVSVLTVPKNLKIFDSEDTLNLTGSYEGGSVEVQVKVTKIEPMAAKSCSSLEVVYLGTNVKTVGAYAFKGCKKLSTIIFRGTKAKPSVKTNAFYDVKKKATIYAKAKPLSYLKKLFKADPTTKKKSFKYKEYKAVG